MASSNWVHSLCLDFSVCMCYIILCAYVSIVHTKSCIIVTRWVELGESEGYLDD